MRNFYRRVGKRLFDLLLSVPAIIIFSPLLFVVAIVVRLAVGRGVFYRQERAGLGGESIVLYKFRTMTDAKDADGNLLPDADRLTRIGVWLRDLSLDELPQLWNVIRGDISLVGPRPLLVRYLPRYTREQFRRHEVLPGITGWAQVNGRNTISWEQKFQLDIWYVDHLSFCLDLKIIIRTASRVLKPNNINAEGHATMPEFELTESQELRHQAKG
jgi:lipopolysaccharide/colanic/teichoic acid biosynthesis glycosyltransferase